MFMNRNKQSYYVMIDNKYYHGISCTKPNRIILSTNEPQCSIAIKNLGSVIDSIETYFRQKNDGYIVVVPVTRLRFS